MLLPAKQDQVPVHLKQNHKAEQRHEGAITYPQLDSANDYIFVHVKENGTGSAREGKVRLFGRNGYFELRIRQEG